MHEHMGLVEARELVADWRFADAEQQRIARTIVAVGKVADLLDQMADDNRITAEQMTWAAPGAKGREHAYTRAAELIRKELGVVDA